MKKIRTLALCLCLCLSFMPVGCVTQDSSWADNLSEQLRLLSQKQPNISYLSMHELIQKIASAMSHDSSLQTAYDSIPDRQKDGVTRDQFQQYILFLRRGIAGTINSFSEMADAEIDLIRTQIASALPDQAEQMPFLYGFWIHYQEIGRPEKKFAVFIRQREDQHPDLYGEWVSQILNLHDLSVLYFDAIDRYDQEALTVLLQPRDFPEEIIEMRAERLIRFYHENVTARSSEFLVTCARMDRIGFEEFGIINPDQSQAVSRNIEMINKPDGEYAIHDIVPEIIHEEDLNIYFEDKQVLLFAQADQDEPVQVRSGDLESIIGPPEYHDDTVCTTTASGSQKMGLTYSSLYLEAEGTCFRHSRWTGVVKKIILTSPECSLGSGLKPGDSETDLLLRYPFAREVGYIIYGQTETGRVTLRFHLENDRIQSIELKLD